MRQGPVERSPHDLERKFANVVDGFDCSGRHVISAFNGSGHDVIGRLHDRTAWEEQGEAEKKAQALMDQPRLRGN